MDEHSRQKAIARERERREMRQLRWALVGTIILAAATAAASVVAAVITANHK